MNKITARLFAAAWLILVCAAAFPAQTKKAKKISGGERLITAFANSKNLPGLFRGDNGVLENPALEEDGGVPPEVKRILLLGKNAIPLLIRHLDDRRVFKHMVFCCVGNEGVQKVSVGEGVLFILVNIIRQTRPIYDLKCLKQDRQSEENNDDSITKKYYWGKNMKRNWLKAYRAEKIRYQKFEY